MNTRVARVTFENRDDGSEIVIERFRFSDNDDVFEIWENCYKAITRVFPNVIMTSFTTIE